MELSNNTVDLSVFSKRVESYNMSLFPPSLHGVTVIHVSHWITTCTLPKETFTACESEQDLFLSKLLMSLIINVSRFLWLFFFKAAVCTFLESFATWFANAMKTLTLRRVLLVKMDEYNFKTKRKRKNIDSVAKNHTVLKLSVKWYDYYAQ